MNATNWHWQHLFIQPYKILNNNFQCLFFFKKLYIISYFKLIKRAHTYASILWIQNTQTLIETLLQVSVTINQSVGCLIDCSLLRHARQYESFRLHKYINLQQGACYVSLAINSYRHNQSINQLIDQLWAAPLDDAMINQSMIWLIGPGRHVSKSRQFFGNFLPAINQKIFYILHNGF